MEESVRHLVVGVVRPVAGKSVNTILHFQSKEGPPDKVRMSISKLSGGEGGGSRALRVKA